MITLEKLLKSFFEFKLSIQVIQTVSEVSYCVRAFKLYLSFEKFQKLFKL
jgi:hypothetical protein